MNAQKTPLRTRKPPAHKGYEGFKGGRTAGNFGLN
jgi:hypothetical protein